ncbi:WAT1-related protein [Citrus sinensis]|nr:WAT1-related protein [Citrus sinensis]
MERRKFFREALLLSATVAVECTTVGLNTLFKAAASKGLSYYVFVAYSYPLATLALLPLPLIFRKYNTTTVVPSFKFSILSRIILLSFIGVLSQIFGYTGIACSSPTLSSAISNLTPAFTFTLAILFRMEKLALRTLSTQAKIIGTMVSISGALVVVLYKGPTIFLGTSPSSTHSTNSLHWLMGSPSVSNWVTGGFLLAAQCFLLSIWSILLTQIINIYPAELLVAFLYNLFAAVIAVPLCLFAEPDLSLWRLKPDVALVSIVYSAFLGPSFNTIIHTWGLRLKGPVYIAIFKPLSVVIAAITGIIFLGDTLHLGRILFTTFQCSPPGFAIVIGAVVICVGFYAVLWGKANEEVANDDSGFASLGVRASSDNTTPLLQSVKVEDTDYKCAVVLPSFKAPTPLQNLPPWPFLPQNQNEIVVVVHAWRDGQRAVKASLAPTILLGRHYTAHFQSAQLQPGPLGYRTKREKASFMFKDINLHLMPPLLTSKVELMGLCRVEFIGSSMGTVVHTWGLHLKGPVRIEIFKALSIAIAATMSFIFLGYALHPGRY